MHKIFILIITSLLFPGTLGLSQVAEAPQPVILSINCKFDDFTFQGAEVNGRTKDGQTLHGVVDRKAPNLDKRFGIRRDNVISYEGEVERIFYSIYQRTPQIIIHRCSGVIDNLETINTEKCVSGGNEVIMRLLNP